MIQRPAGIARRPVILAGAAVLWMVGTSALQAQPQPLFPTRPGLAAPPASRFGPGPGMTRPAPNPILPPARLPAEDGIAARPLAPPGPARLSALDAADPLAEAPWTAIQAKAVDQILQSLPQPNPFTVATRLQRRLLLATAPASADGYAALRLRIDKLLAMGDVEAARLLILLAASLTPQDPLRIQVALASGDAGPVCDQGRRTDWRPPTNGPAKPEPIAARTMRLNLRFVCSWLTDGSERATITARIAAERHDPSAPGYLRILSSLQQSDAQDILQLDPPLRELAMLALERTRLDVTPGDLSRFPYGLQARLIDRRALPARTRLAAARNIAAVGALSPATLRDALKADPDIGPRLAAIDKAIQPTIKAERLRDLWQSGPGGSAQLILAQALSLDMQTMDPSLETVAAARSIVPIAALLGDKGRLKDWFDLLNFLKRDRADVASDARLLASFFRLADLQDGTSDANMSGAADYLAALGKSPIPANWLAQPFDDNPRLSGATVNARQALDTAVLAGGKGSVASAALTLLGDRPDNLPIADRVNVLAALAHAGFCTEAAQLAAAFMIAEGTVLPP